MNRGSSCCLTRVTCRGNSLPVGIYSIIRSEIEHNPYFRSNIRCFLGQAETAVEF